MIRRPHPVTAVLVVAIVVAVIWRIGRSDDGEDRTPLRTRDPVEATGERSDDFERRSYETGDCVVWDQTASLKETQVVPCGESHLAEIVGRSDLPPDEGAYPGEAGWDMVIDEHCGPLADDHLGRPRDPYGRVGLYLLHPSEQGWIEGDRVVWCGLIVTDRDDPTGETLEPFVGLIADLDAATVDPVGTCLLADGSTRVDCAAAHRYEVVAEIDLSTLDERPSDQALFDRCPDVPAGSRAPSGGELDVTFVGFEPESWAAGTRRGVCALAAYGTDDEPVDQTGRMLPD